MVEWSFKIADCSLRHPGKGPGLRNNSTRQKLVTSISPLAAGRAVMFQLPQHFLSPSSQ